MATAMNRSTTAREALVAELLGDVSELLDRVEKVTPAIHGAQAGLRDAAQRLVAGIARYEAAMAAGTENSKMVAVNHITRKTNELTARTLEEQKRAMNESARALFAEEVRPTLLALTKALREIVDRANRPWDAWQTHAATALTSAIWSGGMVWWIMQ